jgi:hypothetical protein
MTETHHGRHDDQEGEDQDAVEDEGCGGCHGRILDGLYETPVRSA